MWKYYRKDDFMKKLLFLALLTTSLIAITPSAFADIEVSVNGEALIMEHQPVIENDRTLIPMRSIFEALGSKVEWDNDTRTVTVYDGMNLLQIAIDSPKLYVNDTTLELDAPARLINEKTYVPLRAVSESLNCEVIWHDETRSIDIFSPKTEHDIKRSYIEKSVLGENDEVMMNIAVSFPQIVNYGENEAIDKVNEAYINKATSNLAKIENDYKDSVIELYNYSKSENIPFSPAFLYYGYEIAYDKFGYLSVVEQLSIGFGTRVQTDYFGCSNFNLTTGEPLDKTDILNLTDEDVNTLSVYSFYLYDNNFVLCLDSDNIIYYYTYNYQPTLALPYSDETSDMFKVNILTGEENPYQEPSTRFVLEDTTNTEN